MSQFSQNYILCVRKEFVIVAFSMSHNFAKTHLCFMNYGVFKPFSPLSSRQRKIFRHLCSEASSGFEICPLNQCDFFLAEIHGSPFLTF